jgi:hypothetical protein
VLTFADPVALRFRRPPLRATLAAAGVGAAAALAAVGWYAWRRPVRS